jgi:RNA polymerase sigma-70 factor, ECF subfamily
VNAQAAPASWLEERLVSRLHVAAHADRWTLSPAAFGKWLDTSARRAFSDDRPDARELERYLTSLHLEDLALAAACAEGIDPAWDQFVRDYRPVLYRAADALDPSGGARELADALYGELFGLTEREGTRQSPFRYFHGRSSLATWLRAILSQRFVDRFRRDCRLVPLPEEEDRQPAAVAAELDSPKAATYIKVMQRVITAEVATLPPRDRLRLRLYYGQRLTLAQIGKALREHEATVSRHLARSRREVRRLVEARLRDEERMTGDEIEECFATVVRDAGPLDIGELLGS